MLVERAFVFSVSGRALLAVVAVAFSVAYALLTAGAMSGLEGSGSALDQALEEPGYAVHRAGLQPFPTDQAPWGATTVHVSTFEGVRLATVKPWPIVSTDNVSGLQTATVRPSASSLAEGDWQRGEVPYAPLDAYILPPDEFEKLVPNGMDEVTVAFLAGSEPPVTHLETTPWRGVGIFYQAGAAQLTSGLVAFVLATGAVAALLSSGFVRLEVLARRADLATLAAVSGPRIVRRVVIQRGLVVVAVGIALGVIGALLALRVLQAALGTPLTVGPGIVILAIVAAGGGSALLATWSGVTALRGMDLARGSGGTSVRRFKGPLRYIFVTPRLFTGVTAAALVATGILSVVLSASAVPDALFGSSEGQEVLISGSGNPLRGHSDAFVGKAARFVEGVRHSMPETFAPTVLDGRPLMVKGTDLDSWRDFASPSLLQGQWPAQPGEATIGVRALAEHDVLVGQKITVPSSYRVGIEAMTIVGVHETGGLADDEVWTDLETSGRLAGRAAGESTLVRIVLEPDVESWASLAPGSGIQVLRVALDAEPPAPLAPAIVVIDVANFDPVPRVRDLKARVNGELVAATTARLDGHELATLRLPAIMPSGSRFVLEVNPTEEYVTRPGGLDLIVPNVARPGEPFDVAFERLQEPASGVEVSVDGRVIGTTDDEGQVRLTVDRPSLVSITGRNEQHKGGAVLRVAPEPWDHMSRIAVKDAFFGTARATNQTHGQIDATLVLSNLGGVHHNGTIEWRFEGGVVANSTVQVLSGQRATVTQALLLPLGKGVLQVAGEDVPFDIRAAPVATDGGSDAEVDSAATPTVAEAIANRRDSVATPDSAGSPQAFLAQLFVTLDAAVVLVVLITALHAGSVVWVSVLREVRERHELVDLYGQVGASAAQIQARAVRDAVLSAIPAIVVGIAAAYVVLAMLTRLGFPAAFGHTLGSVPTAGLMFRVGVALVAIVGVAAAYGVARVDPRRQVLPEDRPLDELARELA